ncbi:farnesyl diphosphate synthase [Limnohabitans sp.]|uniref:polyprenyl synthetase family protein n=1 Tax=Limnohabitans sp. TaxID=1907725 RepID=UPI00286EDE33|nr:farnesyl diphosphate synthase [Limnohabitans sp.]
MNAAHTSSELDLWSDHWLAIVEDALSRWISPQAPAGLGEAMRYAVLDGGKRLRPLLVLAAREAIAHGMADAAMDEAALRAACAVELIHAYSLVHDDMPCMDNDVLRRGKPTVHVQFGEAQALLAGDALQALAFEFLTPEPSAVADRVQARLCRLLATAAGHAGMAGGQAIDLASVGMALSEDQLRQMHRLKTGALLEASVMMGAACGEVTLAALNGLQRYGRALGLAFQVVDDILDVTADSATLGKTAGKDAANEKPTYVSLLGLAAATSYAQSLLSEALDALHSTGLTHTHMLAALAQRVVNRNT